MGLFRLFLAMSVLLSHMGITISGLNIGVTAVVIFYMLAGQVVFRLWLRMPEDSLAGRCRWFYRDRLLRILPMYVFVICFAVVAWLLGAESWFLSSAPGWADWLNNLLIVPLNYYMYSGADTFTLLPPAWSLAAELQFYILVPLLLAVSGLIPLAFAATLSIFVLAQLPVLDTDIFGYRLLAGVGFVFLTGGVLELRANGRKNALLELMTLGAWLGMIGWSAALALGPALREPFNLEVALGYTLGLPTLLLLGRLPLQGAVKTVERLAGALSYGVFLAHFPVIWLLDLLQTGLGSNILLVSLGSVLIALIGHYGVERPLWARYRELLRRPGGTTARPSATEYAVDIRR